MKLDVSGYSSSILSPCSKYASSREGNKKDLRIRFLEKVLLLADTYLFSFLIPEDRTCEERLQ